MAGQMRYLDDIIGLVGIGLLGWGGWQISPAASALIVGGVLILLVVSAAITRAIRDDS